MTASPKHALIAQPRNSSRSAPLPALEVAVYAVAVTLTKGVRCIRELRLLCDQPIEPA